MMATRPQSRREPDDGRQGPVLTTERELVVVGAPEAQLRARGQGLASMAGVDVSSLEEALASSGARIRPLFGPSEDRVRIEADVEARTRPMSESLPDLSRYYRVEAPDD